jgi:hypothetical protein
VLAVETGRLRRSTEDGCAWSAAARLHYGGLTMTWSRLNRRVHMYLALFLAPWMLGYAVSTVAMSHRWIGGPPAWIVEREQPYGTEFGPGTPPAEMARQILDELDLAGAHGVQGPGPDGRVTINRNDLVTPRRIVYVPAERRITIERAAFESGAFLNRLHRRRGYQPPYAADRVMAVSVDAVIAAMVVWALSGLWMWWEMRATRFWGTAAALSGVLLFVLLVFAV